MKKISAFLFCLFLACGPNLRAAPSTPAQLRAELVTDVDSCWAILQEFQASPATAIPPKILKAAQAIVIVNQFKAGFFVGLQGGYGVISVRHPKGDWSIPVLIRAGEGSIGLQFGGASVETIYVITDQKTPRELLNGRLNFGADAKAVGGPNAAQAEAWKDGNILKVPVFVYAKASGLFAGATVKAGFISRDDDANHLLYNTAYNLPELLYSDWVKPVAEVQPLIALLNKIAPR
jgi:lipid-binding SYLF domain-containing protein